MSVVEGENCGMHDAMASSTRMRDRVAQSSFCWLDGTFERDEVRGDFRDSHQAWRRDRSQINGTEKGNSERGNSICRG